MSVQPQPSRRFVFISLMVLVLSGPTHAVTKSGGGGGGGARTGGSTSGASSSSRTSVYGKSYGVNSRIAIVSAAVLAYIWFNGYSYPSMRFYYDGYYDDCALRNATSLAAGGSDADISNTTLTVLPTLIPGGVNNDILAFNETLYHTTNGLIVDPAYCNYTGTNAAAGRRLPALLLLVLAAAASALSLGGLRLGLL